MKYPWTKKYNLFRYRSTIFPRDAALGVFPCDVSDGIEATEPPRGDSGSWMFMLMCRGGGAGSFF